jgi:hypothetical protein
MSDLSSEISSQARRDAPSARRNAQVILDVLRRVLPSTGTVLEIGSGTGQHAAGFAGPLAPRLWLPSDPDADQRASIMAWIADMDEPKPLPPRIIDAAKDEWDIRAEDNITAITSANVVHISPWATCMGIVAGAGRILPTGGVLHFYGPFKRGGVHITESNADFDASLRARDPAWGIRNLDDIEVLATAAGLVLDQVIEMPANNYSVVFKRL